MPGLNKRSIFIKRSIWAFCFIASLDVIKKPTILANSKKYGTASEVMYKHGTYVNKTPVVHLVANIL